MSVSGISNAYANLSSGYKINSAADNASGLSISEKLTAASTGYEVASSNAKDGIGLLNVAEGALSGIHDSLQRIRELSVRSMNGLYSDSDRKAIQMEIDGLKSSIQSTAKGTSFNTLKPLDGSMADLDLATNPEGGSLKIKLVNSTLESLGIADYDVTSEFDLDAIDNAIEMVSAARSKYGAHTNALEHTIRNNDYTNQNLTSANSKLKDSDIGEEIVKKNRDEILEQYKIFSIKSKKETDAGVLKLF